MSKTSTLDQENQTYDGTLAKEIRDVFQSEASSPSRKALNFILGFAAAYQPVKCGVSEQVDVLNN